MKMETADAISLFDSLEPAKASNMLGRWVGQEILTGHPMDGLLVSSYWYGKEFKGDDAVHPLVHRVPIWGELNLNPGLLPIRFATALPFRHPILRILVPLVAPLLSTKKPKARLRTIQFRGRMHAAMCYDARPINDVFAVLDDNSLMGWMDFKGIEKPYFFKLARE